MFLVYDVLHDVLHVLYCAVKYVYA